MGGHAFGSYWRLTLDRGADRSPLAAAINAVVARIDAQMSPFRNDTSVSRFNVTPDTDWQGAPDDLLAVVRAARTVFDQSRGAFDPGVGPTVGRYGFGPITGERRGSFASLEVREGALRKGDAALTLDFCGIAKGYALDLMVAVLSANGVEDFSLELGGEVFARGQHPSRRDWQIAVEALEMTHILSLDGKAVATSGDTVNGFMAGTHRYSHIIDPKNDAPATGDVTSVSVIMEDACRADAWATALFALGLEEGAAVAQELGLPALFQIRDGDRTRPVTTPGFEAHILAEVMP